MTLWLLTQLLQEVVNEVEEAGDRVLGLSRIDLGLLSSLRGLWGERINDTPVLTTFSSA